jgi:hypothetical protein
LAPNGEVALYNCDLRENGWLGCDPLQVEVTCSTLGHQAKTPGLVPIFDGGHRIIREGVFTPNPEYAELATLGGPEDRGFLEGLELTLYPNAPSGYHDNGASGSPANHAQWEGAVRKAFVTGQCPPHAMAQANVDGCRPVLGFFGLGEDGAPVPCLASEHPTASAAGRYRSAGGWGTEVYGTTEHFGRPAGVYPSPWYPNDYYHFAVHQMIGYAAMGSLAAACWVRGSFESIFIAFKKGKLPAARAYRIFGDIADAVVVFRGMGGRWAEYADHLLGVYLPAVLDKLDGESDRLAVVASEKGEEPSWEWNCGERGDTDHLKDSQCSWMTGQLVIGGLRLIYTLRRIEHDGDAVYGRLRVQMQRAVAILVDHAWGDPQRGWFEDVTPWGDAKPGTTHAITGKYRQYVLPALEVARYWLLGESARAPTPRARNVLVKAANRAGARANWLAAKLLEAGWFGTSSTPDKGWSAACADEFWLTCGRLGATTREGWATALGQAQEVG